LKTSIKPFAITPGDTGGSVGSSQKRKRTEVLHRRLISSAVVISLILALMWLDHFIGRTVHPQRPGIVLLGVLLVLAPLAGEELRRMMAAPPLRPGPLTILVAVWLSTLPSCMPVLFPIELQTSKLGAIGWMALGWAAAVGWAFLVEMWRFRAENQALERILRTTLIAVYIGMLGFLAQLRFVGDNTWGLIALLSLVVTVKMSDSFAYLVGRAWGKHKLTPVLSPGKTIEGGLAALLFGILGALLVLFPIAYWLTGSVGRTTWWGAIVFGLAVSIVGIWGDLVESLLKRESHCKDSGSLVPGMGGILDVIDSILGAAAVAFALWAIGLVGP
jgi:phosphatidate cytidylyltransferase